LDGSTSVPSSGVQPVQSITTLIEHFISKGGAAILSEALLTRQEAGHPVEQMDFNPGSAVPINSLPIHSIAALNILLGIPSYARLVLLDRRTAMILLRLAHSVTDDAEGKLYIYF